MKLSRGTKGSVGIDIHLNRDVILRYGINQIALGVKTIIEPGYAAFICFTKSSLALKKIMSVGGVIDSDYRDEWILVIHYLGEESLLLKRGSKVAQVIILPHIEAESEYVHAIGNDTERTGGFGSTGSS